MQRDVDLAAIAARQHALFTTEQAHSIGFTRDALSHGVAMGRWTRVRRGVFAMAGVPPSRKQDILAAVLAAGPNTYASHVTAAELEELPLPRSDEIHLTVPSERRVRMDGIIEHRSYTLHELDITEVSGIPTTTAARTLVDMSSALDVATLGRCADHALRRGRMSLSSFHSTARRHPGISPGRSPKNLTAVLQTRIPGYDAGDSDLETDIWAAIIEAGLPRPQRLHRVFVGDRWLSLDLAYADAKVDVEVDGFGIHTLRSVFETDRLRQNALVLAGWRVLRFTTQSTPEYIADIVRQALAGEPAQLSK